MKVGFRTRLILLHPSSLYKQTGVIAAANHHPHRIWILALLSITTFTFLYTQLKSSSPSTQIPTIITTTSSTLPDPIITALLHYTSTSNTSNRMTPSELHSITTTLTTLTNPHFLIFGLTHETLLFHALTHHKRGRSVFIDENEYQITKHENTVAGFEGYDVHYTTKVSDLHELISTTRRKRRSECRPVQNLLFSECEVAINELPNHLYEIPWDVILVDGPSGYKLDSPGRMSVVFTAGVMARMSGKRTHVFVHDYGREVERVSGEEFLCKENLVEVKDELAHFVIGGEVSGFEFCKERREGGERKVKKKKKKRGKEEVVGRLTMAAAAVVVK